MQYRSGHLIGHMSRRPGVCSQRLEKCANRPLTCIVRAPEHDGAMIVGVTRQLEGKAALTNPDFSLYQHKAPFTAFRATQPLTKPRQLALAPHDGAAERRAYPIVQ